MIHFQRRVDLLKQRANSELQRVALLRSKITNGNLESLDVATKQLADIEHFFLKQLEIQTMTPEEEALWLSFAEGTVGIWTTQLDRIEAQFNQHPDGIQIIGG